MKYEMKIVYDDETRFVEMEPEHMLSDRFFCYALLGMATEIVLRNGLAAPAFKTTPKVESAEARYGVQPVTIKMDPPPEDEK